MAPDSPRLTVVLSGTSSDSHTWNLVFLQLLLAEQGCHVVNLGPCAPDPLIVSECERVRPDLVVLSSVNGHGHVDGARAVRLLRRTPGLATVPVVIGGKLDLGRPENRAGAGLADAGFTAVFGDGDEDVRRFCGFVASLPARTCA
ncbi:cobalamin-dependent protein [Streptosporangiaceae bacterium NEAU-GS5]|nr:cobalamin-dependent protein [Streptosporangiaceae bacterium NEAU-GS5]